MPSKIGWKSYAAMIAISLTIVTIYKTYALFCARATFLRAQKAWDKTGLSFQNFETFHIANQSYNQAYLNFKNQTIAHDQALKADNKADQAVTNARTACVNAYPGKSPTAADQKTYESACEFLTQQLDQQTKTKASLDETLKNLKNAKKDFEIAQNHIKICLRLINNQHDNYVRTQADLEQLIQTKKTFALISDKSSPLILGICQFIQFFLIRFGAYNPR